MAGRFSNPNVQYLDQNGDPLSAGRLGFFESGTSTPLNTYSDDALTVANTNPIVLDDAGRSGDIFFLNKDYKVVLSDSGGTVIWTADPVRSTEQKSSEVRQVSTTTQLDSSDDGKWIAANATSGGFIITLPEASTVGNGYEVTVQKVDSSTNVVTVDGFGSETINGESDVKLETQYETVTVRCDGTQWYAPLKEGRFLTPNHINGYGCSNGSNPATDVDVAPGSARSDDDGANITQENTLTKKLNAAFAEGNNQGGLDTGSVAADSVYDIYAIAKDNGQADVAFSLKGTNLSLPSGFTRQRQIGRLATDGSSNIVANAFTQVKIDGQYFAGTFPSSSGSSVEVRGLPDGPNWLHVGLENVSTTSTADLIMQIGPDAGVETSGYVGSMTNLGTTSLWSTLNAVGLVETAAESREHSGLSVGDSVDGSIYTFNCNFASDPGSGSFISSGVKPITGQLSQLKIAPTAGDFDKGRIFVTAFKPNDS